MKNRLFKVLAVSLPLFASPDLSAEEVTVKQGKMELRGELSLAEDKTLKDGVILMLHGTLAHNSMEIMQNLGSLLKEKGYNTLGINLAYGIDKRPSAMLDCATEHRHRHEDAVAELDTWMKWLQARGADKITLLGHSRGGNQVAWYAAEHTDAPFQKVVLVAPATWDAENIASEYAERYGKPLAPFLREAEKKVEAGKGDTLMEVPGFVYCEKARATADAIVSYYRNDARKNTPDLLEKIKQPVLVVTGSEDDVVADLPDRLKAVKQANVQVETVDGADHFFLDLYGDELADKVADFVD